MKKRLFIVLFAVIMAVACAFGMVACGDDEDSVEGTYTVYRCTSGSVAVAIKEEIALKDGKATYSAEGYTPLTGTYTVKDGKLMVTVKNGSINMTFGKKDNYWIEESMENENLMICKKGETPKGFTI